MTAPAPRRVKLRHLQGSDEEEFLDGVALSRELHRPWNFPPEDGESFREWMARCNGDGFEGRLVVELATDKIVGVFNLSQVFYGNFCSCYLGYYALAPHNRRGFMGEGAALVLHEAFVGLDLHRLEANICPENERSVRFAERSGFRREGFSPRYLKIDGQWRDHIRYALTVEDWRARQPAEPPAAAP